MWKYVSFFLVIIVFGCNCHSYHKTLIVKSDLDRYFFKGLSDNAVLIKKDCEDKETLDWAGSGFIVNRFNDLDYESSKILVVTAAHVVDDEECFYRGRLSTDEEIEIEIEEMDEEIDVAILKGYARSSFKGLLVSTKTFKGQEIHCVGWPKVPSDKDIPDLSITSGNISAYHGKKLIRVTSNIWFGSSGGACYSNESEVLGMVTSFHGYGFQQIPIPGYYYIVSGAKIQPLINKIIH